MKTTSGVMATLLQTEGREGLAREATQEDVLSCHVIERCMIEYVGLAYNGGVARREVAGILLNDSGIVVKSEGYPNPESEQGGGKATNTTGGVDRREPRRQGWGGANGNPDIGWSSMEKP